MATTTIDGISIHEVLKMERIGAHSHIRGLGLSSNLEPSRIADGLVGQLEARKAAGLIVKMIQVILLFFIFTREESKIYSKMQIFLVT